MGVTFHNVILYTHMNIVLSLMLIYTLYNISS